MTKKTWIIFAVICIGIVGGLVYLSNGNKVDVSDVDEWKVQSASEKSGNIADQVYGKKDAKVVMIEYGDYQCPGCASAQSTLKTVAEKYKDKMAFVFRNFPLYSIHPNAFAAASFAEAAGLQGKYWEMHDKLYTTQNEWNQLTGADRTEYFVQAAASVGVDTDKLRDDISNNKNLKKKIDFDVALGKKVKITGTPGIFVNGENFSDKRIKDGKFTSDTKASYVWNDAVAFENLVIKPALKKAGVSIDE